MKYTKRLAIFTLSLTFLLGIYVATASAQGRVRVIRRPVIVRSHWGYDPFRSSRWWWNNDPYMYDPYLREQRDRYYKEKDAKDAARHLREDREKYGSDGVLTAKEQEKLAKRERTYAKAIESLNKFNRDND
jgi:hypothetical protein